MRTFFVFCFLLFPLSVDAEGIAWSEVENVTPEKIIENFRASMESYNSRRSPRYDNVDMKIRNTNKGVHIFLDVGDGILRNQVDVVKSYLDVYSKLTNLQIYLHENAYDGGL